MQKKNSQAQPSKITNENGFILIKWDKPTKIFVGICIFLFVFGVAGKFHTLNIPVWYQIFGEQSKMKKEVIFGQPQTIRSDEWMMATPILINQLINNRPLQNPTAGPDASVRVLGMPINTFSDYFRPNIFLSHFLDVERAVSYINLTKHFFFLIFFFLFPKIITRNNFMVSIFCTLFLYTSGIIQWWTVYTEFIFLGSIICISFFHLIFSKKTKIILFNAVLLAAFTYCYIVFLYPPYQLPCTFIMLLCAIFFFYTHFDKEVIFSNSYIKIGALLFVVLFLSYFLYDYFMATKSTYELTLNTVYPGKRDSTNDSVDYSKMFSEYLFIFIKPEKLPASWGNICEASGTIMVFPVIFFHIVYNFATKQKNSIFLLGLSALMLVFLFHFFVGFPYIINKVTLLSFVPKYRIAYGLGILNVVMLAIYLSANEYRNSKVKIWLTFVFSFLFILSVVVFTNSQVNNFFNVNQIIVATILFGTLLASLVYFDNKWVGVISIIIVLGYNIQNLKANPLSKGLKPFTSNPLYGQIKAVSDADKDAKWIVFGNFIFSAFGKSTGAKVISGVNFVPDFERLKVLDPEGKKDSVYNRYAHITYMPYVNGTDSIVFNLIQSDAYQIYMDPSSEKIKKMGVKYLLFTYNPQPAEVRNLELVSGNVFPIYKVRD
ncbi:MAG: hypothetical protein ACKVOU_14625 [Cytophagales bacterium]